MITCKNCQTEIPAGGNFCFNCGAKYVDSRLNWKHLTDEFSQQFLNWDNRFLRTFKKLLTQPEVVISEYVSGVRKRYINPLSFFAISLTISGFYLYLMNTYFPEVMDMTDFASSGNQLAVQKKLRDWIFEYNSIITFIIVPWIAVISWITFLKEEYNLIEHSVIYFYTMPIVSMLISLITLIAAIFSDHAMLFGMLLWILYFIYTFRLLKKLFQLSYRQMFVKTLIFIPLFFFSYVLFSLAIGVLAFALGVISFQDFAPPA